ncbi:hypothetical protein HOI71_07335, partial [Candidatus Poribacteria bacterium]|nr:hypothetical protein [Candidatus Poribacteria bacterium]
DNDKIDEIGHAEGYAEAAHALILDALSAATGDGATRLRMDTTTFHPWLDSIGADVTVGHHRGWMYRINDLALLLELLAPAMYCRLAASSDAGWVGAVGLQTEIGDASAVVGRSDVTIRRGEIDPSSDLRLVLTHKQAVELVLGQVAPATFARGEGTPVLDSLFPRTEYRWHGWDGF